MTNSALTFRRTYYTFLMIQLIFANNKYNHNTQNHKISVFRTHLYLRSSHKIYGHSWTLWIFSLLSQNSCYSETSSFHHLKNKKYITLTDYTGCNVILINTFYANHVVASKMPNALKSICHGINIFFFVIIHQKLVK